MIEPLDDNFPAIIYECFASDFVCHAKVYCFTASEHQKSFDWPGDLVVEDVLIENKSLEMSCRDGGFCRIVSGVLN